MGVHRVNRRNLCWPQGMHNSAITTSWSTQLGRISHQFSMYGMFTYNSHILPLKTTNKCRYSYTVCPMDPMDLDMLRPASFEDGNLEWRNHKGLTWKGIRYARYACINMFGMVSYFIIFQKHIALSRWVYLGSKRTVCFLCILFFVKSWFS